MKSKIKRNIGNENIEVLKSCGISISRAAMKENDRRFYRENESMIVETQRENRVLRIKQYFERKKMMWPPLQHPNVTICHLINSYYGKDLVKHVPKDKLEKRLRTN